MKGQLRMAKATLRPASAVDRRAAAFHAENPHVYTRLRELALQAQGRGVAKFGIAALFERLRWLSLVETEGDPYRLNNSYRAFYARLLMDQEPSLRGFFTTRDERTDPAYRDRVTRRTRRREPPVPQLPDRQRPQGLPF